MGEFVSMQRGSVELRGEDGKLVSVPMAVLDAASQAAAREAAAQAEKNRPVVSHSAASYSYQMGNSDDEEYLKIRFMEGGKLLPYFGEIAIRMRLSEYRMVEKADGLKWDSVSLTSMSLDGPSTGGDATVVLTYANGVEVKVHLDALSDGVEYAYELTEIPDTLEDVRFRMSSSFPALLEYDKASRLYKGILSREGKPFADLQAFLSEFAIKVTDRKGEREEYEFHLGPKKMKGQEFEIITPAQQDIVFEVEGSALFGVGLYGDAKIVEGFFLEHTVFRDIEEDPVFSVRLR
jgi:hypothetical protein